jgi:hypothetical protein
MAVDFIDASLSALGLEIFSNRIAYLVAGGIQQG